MGTQLFLLDQRVTTMIVAGQPTEVGTLRRSWKTTEVDRNHAAEIKAAKANLHGKPAPVAVIVPDAVESCLAARPSQSVAAHIVLGWDADRISVKDEGWDDLPVIGYVVKIAASGGYVLHEERAGRLHPLTLGRAVELGIKDQKGHFVRRGQASITECRSVRPYISPYAEANCVLSNGRTVDLLTCVKDLQMPETAWYNGKRPVDVLRYPLPEPAFETASRYFDVQRYP